MGFETKQDVFKHPHQPPDAQNADDGAKQHESNRIPAGGVNLLIHFLQRNADNHHANLLLTVVINRREHAYGFGQYTVVNREVLFAFQRRLEIGTDKMLAYQMRVRVRIANALHIGDYGVK